MSKKELQLQFMKLEEEGYRINSRCMLYSFGADNYQEFPAWKYKVIQFIGRHLKNHPYYPQISYTLSLKRDSVNNFNDILRDMHIISQDDEYWQEQSLPSTNSTSYDQTPVRVSSFWNGIFMQQNVADCNAQSAPLQSYSQPTISNNMKQKVFIVHGHDNEAKIEMARTLEMLGFEAIILHEQPNAGRTIIEKIAAYSDVVFAVVLYTECDLGRDKTKKVEEEQYRARQNVVFEHGYLIGKLDREKVAAFVKGNVETPGDISGVVYTAMDHAGAWKQELVREMKAAGLNADSNKLI